LEIKTKQFEFQQVHNQLKQRRLNSNLSKILCRITALSRGSHCCGAVCLLLDGVIDVLAAGDVTT